MIVSYIVSVLFLFTLICRNKLFDLININYKDNSLFVLYIPRINLQQFVYTIDSSLNDVDYNVEILENSDLDNNLFFLASHSGGGRASYFDNLVYLEKGDIIWISGRIKKYVFVVEKSFYIQKNGNFEASYNSEGNTLFLVTCSLKYVDKQLIIRAKLISEVLNNVNFLDSDFISCYD